jgi:hypothetical protein
MQRLFGALGEMVGRVGLAAYRVRLVTIIITIAAPAT